MADILVVIVTFNAIGWLERCLDSVASSEEKADLTVIDNGSTDGTLEELRRRAEAGELTLITPGENLGFGAGNNLGLRLALEKGYRFVYLLNQDTWLMPDTLGKLKNAFGGRFGILSPMQMQGDGKALDYYFSKHCKKALEAGGNVVEVPFVMAAHWMISRDALLKTGLFSPAFKHYGEDENYIDRLHCHGLECGVVKSAAAVHDRAGRKRTKDAAIRLKCVRSTVRVSDPGRNPAAQYLVQSLRLCALALRHWSSVPLHSLANLWKRRSDLMRLREISKEKGAFISAGA